MIITLVIVIAMVVLIISDKLPFGAPALMACAALVITGQADVATAFSGFVDKNVVMIAGFMACMAALQKTTFMGKLQDFLGNMAKKGGYRNYVLLLIAIMVVGNFLSGTAFYLLVLTVVSTIPYNKALPTSKIVLPAGMATGFGSWLPTGLAIFTGLVSSLVSSAGGGDVTVDVGKASLINIVCSVVFLLWSMVAYKFLPDNDISDLDAGEKVDLNKEHKKVLTDLQEKVVYVGYIVLLLALTFQSKIPGEISYGLPAAIACVFLCCGCLSFKELLGNWFSPLMVMMASVIGVAAAMSNSGITALIGEKIAGLLGSNPNPFVLVLVFCLLTSISATFTGASFGSLFIFAPIGIALCLQYGYSPIALTYACVKAAWINYFMPIDGLPALAMGMGKYKPVEFWKYQIPLWVMHILVVAGLCSVLFPA